MPMHPSTKVHFCITSSLASILNSLTPDVSLRAVRWHRVPTLRASPVRIRRRLCAFKPSQLHSGHSFKVKSWTRRLRSFPGLGFHERRGDITICFPGMEKASIIICSLSLSLACLVISALAFTHFRSTGKRQKCLKMRLRRRCFVAKTAGETTTSLVPRTFVKYHLVDSTFGRLIKRLFRKR